MNVIMELEKEVMREDLPEFRSGDTVAVHYKIKEGERERIQVFEGVVIAMKGGGAGETFIVRKVSYGVGVERIFALNSPLIDKIVVKKLGKVRRAKLYYLRGRSKKASRIRERARIDELKAQGPAATASVEEIIKTETPVEDGAVPETLIETVETEAVDAAPETTKEAQTEAKPDAAPETEAKAEETEAETAPEVEEAAPEAKELASEPEAQAEEATPEETTEPEAETAEEKAPEPEATTDEAETEDKE